MVRRTRDFSTVLTGTSALFFAGGVWSAYKRRFWPMIFFANTAFLLKLWYIDRMTFYYEQHRNEVSINQSGKNEAGSRTHPDPTPKASSH